MKVYTVTGATLYLLIAPLMELKWDTRWFVDSCPITFNRTAYGIEIDQAHVLRRGEQHLLIAPLMELKFGSYRNKYFRPGTFNRTAYGIEMVIPLVLVTLPCHF